MAARFARAHRTTSARARHGPSEASVKFFGEAFFQKSFDLALALTGRAAHERKLGKQRSVFPGRWGSERVVPRGWVASYRCALSALLRRALSPAGSGDAAQWAAPITDRRGSEDAGTAPAVTERAPPQTKRHPANPGCPSFFLGSLRLPYSTSTVQPKVSSTLPV